eukprot:382008-Amphidinium_carterae.4
MQRESGSAQKESEVDQCKIKIKDNRDLIREIKSDMAGEQCHPQGQRCHPGFTRVKQETKSQTTSTEVTEK